jgi:hypothetical protein
LFRKTRFRAHGTGAIYAKHRVASYVILRGLIAPILMPMLRFRRPIFVLRGACVSFGRLEAYLLWRFSQNNCIKHRNDS